MLYQMNSTEPNSRTFAASTSQIDVCNTSATMPVTRSAHSEDDFSVTVPW